MIPYTRFWITLTTCLLIAVAGHAEEGFPEPEGVGKAKFGMSIEQVKQVYPRMRQTGGRPPGEPTPAIRADFFELKDHQVEGLGKCEVSLRFFQEEFYEAQFRCPDAEKVKRYLIKKFGVPTQMSERALMWIGQRSAVTCNPTSGAFMYGDVKRSGLMQGVLLHMMQQPAAKPTPVAEPK